MNCVLLLLLCLSVGAKTLFPSTPYHIYSLQKGDAKVDTFGDFFLCAKLRFRNTGNFTSTHWSVYVRVFGAIRQTQFFDAKIQDMNVFEEDSIVVTAQSLAYNAALAPGEAITLNHCIDKSASTQNHRLRFEGQMLFVFDTENPPNPLVFEPPEEEGTILDSFNDCLPMWGPDVEKYIIIAEDLVALEARIAGRVAVSKDAFIDDMIANLADDDCNSPCNGSVSEDATLVVGGTVTDWNTGTFGLCGGFIQGFSQIESDKLEEIEEGCPALVGANVDDYVNFAAIFQSMQTASLALSKKLTTGWVGYTETNGKEIHFMFGTRYSAEVQSVFMVPSGKFAGGARIRVVNDFESGRSDYIIINVAGKSPRLASINMDEIRAFAFGRRKVLFNFFEAQEVELIATIMYGSILAPNAKVFVSAGSVVTGSILAKEVKILKSQLFPQPWKGFEEEGTCLECKDGSFGESCKLCTCDDREVCDDGATGTGICSCKPGWNQNCTDCQGGLYGPECRQTCTEACLLFGTCDDGVNGTGACTSCEPGFVGDQCDRCDGPFWGPRCDQPCTRSCELHGECSTGPFGDGFCTCTEEGWAGTQCDACGDAYYGEECQFKCADSCSLNGVCDSGFNGTGACLSCNANFTGEQCEFCNGDFWGPECSNPCTATCLERGVCDVGPHGTGSCSSCEGNFGGDQCEGCAAPGIFGANCDQFCTNTCMANGICIDGINGNGLCFCGQGRTGIDCEFESGAQQVALHLTVLLGCLVAAVLSI